MDPFVTSYLTVSELKVPVVTTDLNFKDFIGAIRVRWGIGRDKYRVNPGLYANGAPDLNSDVFVTSNYKLSFDHLRKNLKGINGWIIVLDTKGINVWCAAGKKTFGTDELVKRIKEADLASVVSHRKVILPQLGATGVSAHKVKEATGFNVHYGPVRAADIKDFIKAGYRASREMRKVNFGFYDRLKLVPNDLVQGKLYLFIAAVSALIISGLSFKGGNLAFQTDASIHGILYVLMAYCTGIIITPALLPYLPFRMFSLKGLFSGIVVSAVLFLITKSGLLLTEKIGWLLIFPAISSFLAMNFTGSSTYTSLSGVKREMKFSIPLQISMAASGIIFLIISWF